MFWFDFSWEIQNLLNQFWWPIQFALLVIAVAIGFLAYKKPAYAVGLTILMLPTYLFRSYIYFLPFTFLEVCIWILAAGYLIGLFKRNEFKDKKLISYRPQIFFILLASTVAIFISPGLASAAGLWKAYFVQPILFFAVFVNVIKTKKDQEIILWSLGLVATVIATIAIYQKFTGWGIFEPGWTGPNNRRVTSLFTSPNAVGLFLAPVMTIYFGWLLSEIKNLKKSLIKIFVIALGLTAIVFTISQGTWLGLLVAFTFMAFFGWNKKITTTVVVLGTVLILITPVTREKIWPTVTLQDASGQNRLELWSLASDSLLQNPISGNGLLGFATIQNANRDPLKIEPLLYPHNIILNFWTEIGLLGLVAFSWLVVKFFRRGFKKVKENKWLILGVMAAMITVMVHGFIDVPYFKNDLAVLFWIIIALI